jgi:hypothetical protein
MTKSQARIAAAWERRKDAQVGPVSRRGAGSIPALVRISHTVEAAMMIPRPASSPWMRRYPHDEFSLARRRMRVLMVR